MGDLSLQFLDKTELGLATSGQKKVAKNLGLSLVKKCVAISYHIHIIVFPKLMVTQMGIFDKVYDQGLHDVAEMDGYLIYLFHE